MILRNPELDESATLTEQVRHIEFRSLSSEKNVADLCLQ